MIPIRHHQVLEPVPCGAHRFDAHLCGCPGEAASDDSRGLIADDMEARLLPCARGGGDVHRNLVFPEVGGAHGGRVFVDVRRREAGRVGTDRTINEEIPRRTARPQFRGHLLALELAPVPDHLWQVGIATEGEGLAQIIGAADGGPGVFVEARNATLGCRGER